MPKNRIPFPWQIAEMLKRHMIPIEGNVYVDPYDRHISHITCGTLHTRVDGSMGRYVTKLYEHEINPVGC